MQFITIYQQPKDGYRGNQSRNKLLLEYGMKCLTSETLRIHFFPPKNTLYFVDKWKNITVINNVLIYDSFTVFHKNLRVWMQLCLHLS